MTKHTPEINWILPGSRPGVPTECKAACYTGPWDQVSCSSHSALPAGRRRAAAAGRRHTSSNTAKRGAQPGVGEHEKPQTDHKDGWTCSFRTCGATDNKDSGSQAHGFRRMYRLACTSSPKVQTWRKALHWGTYSICLEGDWEEAGEKLLLAHTTGRTKGQSRSGYTEQATQNCSSASPTPVASLTRIRVEVMCQQD